MTDEGRRAGAVETGQVAGAGKPKRQPTAMDMVRSLAVILIPLLIITWVFTRSPDKPVVQPVNWQPVYAAAQKDSPYPVLAPVNLPSGWTPTRVEWTKRGLSDQTGTRSPGNEWTLGFLSPNKIYFAVRQTDSDSAAFVTQVTRSANTDGTSVVNGTTWQRYVTDDNRTRALVRVTGKSTTVVVADAHYDAIEGFAATLSAG